jgi:hypothetical protein
MRRFNWSKKAKGRRTEGTGRCQYLKTLTRKFKNGDSSPFPPPLFLDTLCFVTSLHAYTQTICSRAHGQCNFFCHVRATVNYARTWVSISFWVGAIDTLKPFVVGSTRRTRKRRLGCWCWERRWCWGEWTRKWS